MTRETRTTRTSCKNADTNLHLSLLEPALALLDSPLLQSARIYFGLTMPGFFETISTWGWSDEKFELFLIILSIIMFIGLLKFISRCFRVDLCDIICCYCFYEVRASLQQVASLIIFSCLLLTLSNTTSRVTRSTHHRYSALQADWSVANCQVMFLCETHEINKYCFHMTKNLVYVSPPIHFFQNLHSLLVAAHGNPLSAMTYLCTGSSCCACTTHCQIN